MDNRRVPFTLAHTAAALPFRRLRLVPSALIVGTVAPDCEYFLRLGPAGGYGHTPTGALLLSLPLGLAILWMFHALVKEPAASLLPDALQRRLPMERFSFRGPSRIAWIVASVALGIATHLGWDSFTHRTMWLYWHWPLLQGRFTVQGLGSAPVYKVLQHLSTALGLVVLAVWFARWYRSTVLQGRLSWLKVMPSQKRAMAGFILATATGVALLRGFYGARNPYEGRVLATFAGDAICTFVAACWWQLVVLGSMLSRSKLSARVTKSR